MPLHEKALQADIRNFARIGTWEWNIERDTISCSPEAHQIFEIPIDAGLKPSDMVRFRDATDDLGERCLTLALRDGTPWQITHRGVTALGRKIWLASTGHVERVDGRSVRMFGLVQDVTDTHNAKAELERSRELLVDLAALSGIGGWEYDVASNGLLWTRQALRILEATTCAEPTFDQISQMLGTAARQLLESSMLDAIKLARPYDIEFDMVTFGGREIAVRSIGRPRQVGKRTVQLVGSLEDVTVRRAADADRRRNEALQEQVSRLANIGGWQFDLRTRQTTWSPQVRKIFEVGEAYNPPLEEHEKFIAPGYSDIVNAARRRAIVDGIDAEIEYEAVTASGRRIWLRNIYKAERVEGRTTRLLGTAQDITAAKMAQAELDLLHVRLRAAIEAAELRVWQIDLDTRTLHWSPDMPLTFAVPAMGNQLDGAAVLEFIHPDDRESFARQVSRVAFLGKTSVRRIRMRGADGGFRHLEVRMRMFPTGAGGRKILGVSRDITRDVELTEELRRKKREAEQSSLAKSQFVARMSHEIRTPMSGVIGMLEVLMRAETDDIKRAHSATALKSARDLMFVLDDIIDASQLESRLLSLEIEAFSVAAVVGDVVTLFRAVANEKSLTLTGQVDASMPEWVTGDPRRFRQVLTNLVGNAVKFTDVGGIEVIVGYDPDQEIVRVLVRDTGRGIPADIADKIFEPFYQADSSSTRQHGGSGLGLAISQQLVGMMGGEIRVESRLGEGSAFHFSIVAPATQPPEPENVALPEPATPSLRILVAEDNPAMQNILRALLEADGHTLTVVSDGRDAVAKAASDTFDVVLMDAMMPGMDGPTATQRIRELGGRAGGVPIVALTANALLGDRDRYLAIGMTDYLSKPIVVADLLAVLRRVTAPELHRGGYP